MYEIFEKLMRERGLTAYRISRDTGVSQTTLSDWKHGRSTPKLDKLQKLAAYLGVPLSYLMGEEADPSKKEYRPTDEEIKKFLFGDAEVTDELYEQLKAYARFLKEQTDRELAERDKNKNK